MSSTLKGCGRRTWAGCARRPLAERRQGLVDRQLGAHRRVVLGDDLLHLGLDAREVGLGDRLGQLEVVVEAVLDGRADRVLGARPEPQDGLRHDVRGGVTQDLERLGVVGLERDDGEGVAVVQRRGDVDEARFGCAPVAARARHAARDGGLRQSRADRRRGVVHGRAVVEFERGAVGEGDVKSHAVPGPFCCARPHTCAGAVDRESVAGEARASLRRPAPKSSVRMRERRRPWGRRRSQRTSASGARSAPAGARTRRAGARTRRAAGARRPLVSIVTVIGLGRLRRSRRRRPTSTSRRARRRCRRRTAPARTRTSSARAPRRPPSTTSRRARCAGRRR